MQKINADVLLLEACDFNSYPPGGQLSFAKQLMTSFGSRLALVGLSSDGTPVGKWVIKEFEEIRYNFFAIDKYDKNTEKPIIPRRLSSLIQLKHYEKIILSSGISNIFIQSPELMWVASKWPLQNKCYMYPGVDNPLEMPRYKWGRIFSKFFDIITFLKLKNFNLILACADEKSIEQLIARSKYTLSTSNIIKFPTRVDTSIFFPENSNFSRKKLSLPIDRCIFLFIGRLNKVKGWEFILNSFINFNKFNNNSSLIFVGDGEDKDLIRYEIIKNNVRDEVILVGNKSPREVALYLNAANVYLVGSFKEGWSLSMLEALATGKPLVSTNVSGASEMILEGENGFIVYDRDPKLFSEAMTKALLLQNPNSRSISIANKYSISNLARDLGALWPPLS